MMNLFSLSSELSNALLRSIAQHSQVELTIKPTVERPIEPTFKPAVEPAVKPLSMIRGNCCTLVDHDTAITILFFAIHLITRMSTHKQC